MTNTARAEAILAARHYKDQMEGDGAVGCFDAAAAVAELAAAGLLAPDLPAGFTREEARAVREWAERARAAEVQDETVAHAARVLLAVLPEPPTLADMPREERAECRWMQADVKGRSARYAIATPSDRNGLAGLVSTDGGIEWTYPERVTPRPDLPRLQWPSDQETEDEAPDALAVGDVIESADDPRLDDLPLGTTLLDRDNDAITKRGDAWHGLGYYPTPGEGDEFGPWKVVNIPEPNPEP